jgi:protein SCO1/2
VSIDPERDTLEALRAFRQQNRLESDRWRLLRGSPGDVQQLADSIGFNYYPGSKLQFAHSLLITELNPAGEIVYQQSGLGRSPREAVTALLRLVRKQAK